MEFLITLILLTIVAVPIIILVWFKVSLSNLIREAISKVNSINDRLDKMEKVEKEEATVVDSEDEHVAFNESLLNLMETLPSEEEKQEIQEQGEEKEEFPKEEVKPTPEKIEPVIPFIEHKVPLTPKVEKSKKSKKTTIKEPKKNRDWEKFIGENLINKIGIGVLVLGIAYFVNFAIDNNWISEVGRVAIGILSGGILTFLAHKIRRSYKAFSSVLVGGAMAVFYYTISIGFHEYQLFTQPVAFALMVLITGFSVLLSISYDRKELAILALIGSFSTPLMVSNGAGNYQVLFGYLAIVNVGMLVLAYFKKWNIVNILSLAFTVLFYGGWFADQVIDGVEAPYRGALFFAVLYYLIFFLMHIINNVKEKRKFKGYEFGLMLTTTALFYAAGMAIFYLSGNQQYQGLFTVGLGVFNLLFAYPLFRKNKVDKSLVFLLIGIVLTFVSLAAPVQLSGNYITMFWVTEMVVLLWLGQKTNIKFMKMSSLIIFGLMLVSLVMDWEQIYYAYRSPIIPVIINKGFITSVFAILGITAYSRLLSNEKGETFLSGIKLRPMQNIVKIILGAFSFMIGVIELEYQLSTRLDYEALTAICTLGFTYLFSIGVMVYAKKAGRTLLQQIFTTFLGVLIFTYPFFNGMVALIRNDYLMGEVVFGCYAVQYFNLFLIGLLSYLFVKEVRNTIGLRSGLGQMVVVVFSIVMLVVASAQLGHHTMLLFFDQLAENGQFIYKQTVKIGYPIVWGISSFVLMLVGMKYKFRTLRIISLSVFSIILFKLFFYDIKGASEAGKIVAFILLGVLLLVISFMYQRLKKLILNNGDEA